MAQPSPTLDPQTGLDRPWKVIVFDDPVNLYEYVIWVFQRVLGYSLSRASILVDSIQRHGRGVVWTGEREAAEMMVSRLHAHQLRATLEQDA